MSKKTFVYTKDELFAVRDSMRTLGGKAHSAASTIPKHLYVASNLPNGGDGQEKDLSRESLFGAAGGKPRRSSGSGHHQQQQQQQQQHTTLAPAALSATSSATSSLWVYRTKDSTAHLSNSLSLEAIQNLFLDGLVEAEEVELRRVEGGPFMSFKEAQQQRALSASMSSSNDGSSPVAASGGQAPATATNAPSPNVWRRHTNSSSGTAAVVGSSSSGPSIGGASGTSATGHPRMSKAGEQHYAAPGTRLPSKAAAISRDDMPSAEELAHLQQHAAPALAGREQLSPDLPTHAYPAAAVVAPSGLGPSMPCPIASIDEPEFSISSPPAPMASTQQSTASRQARSVPVAVPTPLPCGPVPQGEVMPPQQPASSAWGKVEAPPTVDISQLLVEEKRKASNQAPPSYGWAGGTRQDNEVIDRPGGDDRKQQPPQHGYVNSFPSLDELAGSSSSTKSPLASSGSQRGPNRPPSGPGGLGKGPMPQHQQTTSRKGKNVAQQFFH